MSGTGDWRYVDVTAARAGKLAALEYVRQLYGVHHSRCVAAGDSGNDTLMLGGRNLAIGGLGAGGRGGSRAGVQWLSLMQASMSRRAGAGAASWAAVGTLGLYGEPREGGPRGVRRGQVPASPPHRFPEFASTPAPPRAPPAPACPAVVGNAQPELVQWVLEQPQEDRMVVTDAPMARGILEGLARHGLY